MSGFDFVFALFSLILGLAIAEVLGGFGGVMRLHARARAGIATDIRVGFLVPLLAVLVVLNQLQFWMQAYAVRDNLPLTYLTLIGVVVVVGGYYLFSILVFPDDPQRWPDFDDYYDQHNRFILSGMLILNIAVIVVTGMFRAPPTAAQRAAQHGPWSDLAALGVLGAMLLLFALIFVKGRRLNMALLVAVIALTLCGAVVVPLVGI